MKQFAKLTASVLCAALTVFASAGTAYAAANPDADDRGKAVYYGRTIDDDTLYDDEKLKSIGFDDTDIDYLEQGLDVTYEVVYDSGSVRSYSDLGELDSVKALIDSYFGDVALSSEDTMLARFYPTRKRGGEQPEILSDVRNVTGTVELSFAADRGNIEDILKDGTFTMLYLNTGTASAQSTKLTASANSRGNAQLEYEFLGTGDYFVAYNASSVDSVTSDSSDSPSGDTSSNNSSSSSADSSSQSEQRGKATYYENVMDEKTLYDDAELKRIGFDDTDIDYLKRGLDVTYMIQHDKNSPKNYGSLDADSTYRKLINNYFGKTEIKPDDSLLTYFYPTRQRGDGEPETLTDVRNVRGKVELALSKDQGNVHDYINNGRFTMLYLDSDTAQSCDINVTANSSENIVIDFNFLGTGNYIVIYENRSTSTNDTSSGGNSNNSNGQNSTSSGYSASSWSGGTNYTTSGSGLSFNNNGTGTTTDTTSRDNPGTGLKIGSVAAAVAAGVIIVLNRKKGK